MGRCRIIYRSDGRRITTGIIVLPRRCRLLRGYLRRRLYLLQKIPMRIIEHRILPLLRCRFLVLLPPTASRMRRTNGMRGEMRRSWGRMLWELLPPGTTSLDSLVCTVITALTVGGSSTMSFMEGIRLAISSSTQVSPTDSATPSANPRPKRSHSARIPVNDVDALVLPPRRTADHLVDLYFKYVHTLYPWLHEPSFRAQYESLWMTPPGSSSDDDPLFYCLLNLVLALGCQFSTLFESSIHSGDTFFNRAKTLLGFSIFDVGTLKAVQALLLMGSYLQSTNRPNRCWNVLGMGIRVAQGLGLHIERGGGDLVERETRRRAWWGCVLMDRYINPSYK